MQISKDTQKNSQKLYQNIFGSLIKQASINLSENSVLQLIRRQKPVTQYPWATLANLQNRIFTQYFCNTDTFTIKSEARSKFGAIVKVKQICNITKNSSLFLNEWNFRIPFGEKHQDSAFDCRVSNNDFKIVFNHGYRQHKGLKIYFNEQIGFNKGSKNHNLKLGFTAVWNNIGSDNRIKIDQNRNLTLYTKFISKLNKYKIGVVGTFDLSKKLIAQKSMYFGYTINGVEINFKADQTFGRRTMNYNDIRQWFSQLSLTTIYKIRPSTRVAFQMTGFPQSGKANAVGLIEHISHIHKSQKLQLYKLKIDSLLTLSALARYQYNTKFTFSIGCKIPFYDRKQINKFGVRVDINA